MLWRKKELFSPTRMAATVDEVQVQLNKKYEEILRKRAVLLGQMESRYEQQKSKRKQWMIQSQAARERNDQLLEDLQKMEVRLRTRQLPHPTILALETRYWASVEDSIPEWERFFLGKGPHPIDAPDRIPSRRPKLRSTTAQDQALPPRPKPRPIK